MLVYLYWKLVSDIVTLRLIVVINLISKIQVKFKLGKIFYPDWKIN